MVAGKSSERKDEIAKQWSLDRIKLSTAIRRSPDVSPNAYSLWLELAFGWAWYEPTCFPTCTTLAVALNTTERTVHRLLNELEANGLVTRKRQRYGNRYRLVSAVPPKLQTDLLDNNKIVQIVRARGLEPFEEPITKGPRVTALAHLDAEPTHPDRTDSSHLTERPRCDEFIMSDVMNSSDDPSRCDEFIMSDAMNSSHKVVEGKHENASDEKYENGRSKPVPASPASSDPQGMTGLPRASRGNEGSRAMAEAEDLLAEDEAPHATKGVRRKSKQRAASASLVSQDDQPLTPFPEALGSSQSEAGIRFEPPPPPPPVEKPEDVLRLLKGESEARWGKKSTKGFAMELTGELSGKITNTILRKYPPDVILAMVRLLVWDWEVARGVCFPFRPDVAHPDVTALVQYAKELAARIGTGFNYMTSRRGALNTYHDLFIRKLAFIPDDDPF